MSNNNDKEMADSLKELNDMMGDKSFKRKRYLFFPNADVALKILDEKKENE